MGEPLLSDADRARLREFTAAAGPEKVANGSRLADQLRAALPSLDDEQIAAVVACTAQVAGMFSSVTGCHHVHSVAMLLQGAAADLAALDLDRPP
ncbi:MAG: hypothetical protein ACRDPY_15215 [Streptosporangiaceae bacterium]